MSLQRNLLIVDDELNILKTLKRQLNPLQQNNYTIYTAQSGAEALEILQATPIQVIISDQRMPNMTGVELLSQTKLLYPQTIRLILSGYTDFFAIQEAINNGNIYKFLNKPWQSHELISHINDAFTYHDIHLHNAYAKQAMMNAIEAVVIANDNHVIQSVNTAFCLATEYSAFEVVGSFVNLFDHDHVSMDEITEIYKNVALQGVWQGELYFRKKSGRRLPVFLSVSAIRDEMDNIAMYIYSFIEQADTL
ncbi:response regulator [Legionella sp. km772]|uniref:response regulator n=1 Tax=Legionella sp. km772 TaxID=2498111 RepID=UPI0013154AAA|nr:response regulator [Legionella sp. km772]